MSAATNPWFAAWFRAMPHAWQAGLHTAMKGGAWLGELDEPAGSGQPRVCVLFLAPHVARRVEAFLASEGRHELGECDPLTCLHCKKDLDL